MYVPNIIVLCNLLPETSIGCGGGLNLSCGGDKARGARGWGDCAGGGLIGARGQIFPCVLDQLIGNVRFNHLCNRVNRLNE
jgi:hypothetical protein